MLPKLKILKKNKEIYKKFQNWLETQPSSRAFFQTKTKIRNFSKADI